MSKFSNQEIIKRYSNALHNLATEEKKLEIIIMDLKKLEELSKQNQEFNKLLQYPLISSFKQRVSPLNRCESFYILVRKLIFSTY